MSVLGAVLRSGLRHFSAGAEVAQFTARIASGPATSAVQSALGLPAQCSGAYVFNRVYSYAMGSSDTSTAGT
jgi:hypothetical protein